MLDESVCLILVFHVCGTVDLYILIFSVLHCMIIFINNLFLLIKGLLLADEIRLYLIFNISIYMFQ